MDPFRLNHLRSMAGRSVLTLLRVRNYSGFDMLLGRLILTFGFWFSTLLLLPAAVEELNALDVNPIVSEPLGYDRASKYLIQSSVPGRDRIGVAAGLDLIGTLMTDPDFQDRFGITLEYGDYRLVRVLRQMLLLLGMGDRESAAFINQMAVARAHENPTVRHIFGAAADQTSCRQLLLDYMVQMPEKYPAIVSGLAWIWSQPNLRLSNLFQQRFQSVLPPGGWSQLLAGDLESRWKFNELVEPQLIRPNVFSESIIPHASDLQTSPYTLFWSRWIAQLDNDPQLQHEMMVRLRKADLVYGGLQQSLTRALSVYGGDVVRDYFLAKEIPNSRYLLVFERFLTPDELIRAEDDHTFVNKALAKWVQMVQHDRSWTNFLIWHFTRPATSLGQVTLYILEEQLAGNQALAIAAFDVRSQYGLDKDIESRRQQGKMTSSDWLEYGKNVGFLFQSDSQIAMQAMSSRQVHVQSDAFFTMAMSFTMQSSSVMVKAWSESMLRSDSLLRNAFLGWVVQKGVAKNEKAARAWLMMVTANADHPVDPIVGQFKQAWAAWISTDEGRRIVRLRLSLEIWGLPYDLRTALISAWSDEVENYFKWRRMASYLPIDKGGILRRDGLVMVREPSFLLACIDALKADNKEVEDVMVPVWRAMFLRPGGELVKAFAHEFTDGPLMGEAYAAGAIALIDAIQRVDPAIIDQSLYRLNLSDYPPGEVGRAKLSDSLLKGGGEVRPIVVDLMGNQQIWTAWRSSLFSAVLFAGKGKAAAELLSRNSGLEKIWANQLDETFLAEPLALNELMRVLIRGTDEQAGHSEQLIRWRKKLMRANSENQYFFEQMYADPTGGYHDQFEDIAHKTLSNYDTISKP